jgi:integrase
MIGSIQKRGDSYLLTVSKGFGLNGKRDRQTRTIRVEGKTEVERYKNAEKELALFLAEIENGEILSTKLTVEGFSKKWLTDYAEKNLAPKTLHGYKSLLNLRIIPALGHLQLSKLRPTHFIAFYNNLTEEGIRLDSTYILKQKVVKILAQYKAVELMAKANISENTMTKIRALKSVSHETAKKLANVLDMKVLDLFDEKRKTVLYKNSIEHYRRLINVMMNTAVTWGILRSNPAHGIKVPKIKKDASETESFEKVKFYDLETTQKLIECLAGEPIKYQAIVLLTLYTGLREGEIMGLDLENLDLEKAIIKVKNTSQYIPGQGVSQKDTPKTASSRRDVAFSTELIPLLEKYLLWRKEQRLKCGSLWTESNKVFVREDGKPMHTYTPLQWLRKFTKRNGLPAISFHGLRHTHPTLLLEMGFNDLKEISSRLGHTDIRTTMNIYAHQLKSIDREAANIFGANLNRKLVDKAN